MNVKCQDPVEIQGTAIWFYLLEHMEVFIA